MRSGTPPLREMKPDPMPAADRGRSALPGRRSTEYGVLHRVLSRAYLKPLDYTANR